jgi:hypothetical protein
VSIDWNQLLSDFVYKVFATIVGHKSFLLFLLSLNTLIVPFDGSLLRIDLFLTRWWDGAHLRIDEGVSQEELLTSVRWILVGKFVPLARDVKVV